MSRKSILWSLAALTLIGIAGCARHEAAAEQQVPALAAPAAAPPAADATGAAPALPVASAHSPAAKTAPTFESRAAGLSVLTDERIDAEGNTHEWLVARIDLSQHRLKVHPLGALPFADLLSKAAPLVAVNGGFFDPQLGASGLLISGGTVLARERRGAGSGVLAVAKGAARLLPRGERLPPATDFAVQCGPRLVEPGGIIGIRNDDGQRAARTAACIRDSGRELNLVVTTLQGERGRGPGLLQLARWLTEPLAPGEPSGCDAALNLDGGPSTGMFVAGPPDLFRPPLGPVPFALLVAR